MEHDVLGSGLIEKDIGTVKEVVTLFKTSLMNSDLPPGPAFNKVVNWFGTPHDLVERFLKSGTQVEDSLQRKSWKPQATQVSISGCCAAFLPKIVSEDNTLWKQLRNVSSLSGIQKLH